MRKKEWRDMLKKQECHKGAVSAVEWRRVNLLGNAALVIPKLLSGQLVSSGISRGRGGADSQNCLRKQ